uniref:Ectonucleoside triphosphate diphosphohydrolase 3 n=1 Tax=Laticauda laticaudata TaxID=8630 RepID=A0A8C5SZW5_LATLA
FGTWVHPHGVETIGALDLGGASTQISFIPEETIYTSNSTLQVQLFGYQYSVYTYSFQCYGRDETEKKPLTSILYRTVLTMKHLYGSLCRAFLKPVNYSPSQYVDIIGTGNPVICREAVSTLFDFKSCRDREDCSFNGIYQPKVKGNFMVSPNYYPSVPGVHCRSTPRMLHSPCRQTWKQPSLRSNVEGLETVSHIGALCTNGGRSSRHQTKKPHPHPHPQLQRCRQRGRLEGQNPVCCLEIRDTIEDQHRTSLSSWSTATYHPQTGSLFITLREPDPLRACPEAQYQVMKQKITVLLHNPRPS